MGRSLADGVAGGRRRAAAVVLYLYLSSEKQCAVRPGALVTLRVTLQKARCLVSCYDPTDRSMPTRLCAAWTHWQLPMQYRLALM